MTIIEIAPLPNGAHRNQSWSSHSVPAGWAVMPNELEPLNFPFGDIEYDEVNGVMTVTKWTARTFPSPTPTELPPTPTEQLRADVDYIAAMTGVEL